MAINPLALQSYQFERLYKEQYADKAISFFPRKLASHPHERCVSLSPPPSSSLLLSPVPLLLLLLMNTVRPIVMLKANASTAPDGIVAGSGGASQTPERLIVEFEFEGGRGGDILI